MLPYKRNPQNAATSYSNGLLHCPERSFISRNPENAAGEPLIIYLSTAKQIRNGIEGGAGPEQSPPNGTKTRFALDHPPSERMITDFSTAEFAHDVGKAYNSLLDWSQRGATELILDNPDLLKYLGAVGNNVVKKKGIPPKPKEFLIYQEIK